MSNVLIDPKYIIEAYRQRQLPDLISQHLRLQQTFSTFIIKLDGNFKMASHVAVDAEGGMAV